MENTICICACSDNGCRRVTLNLFCLRQFVRTTVWLWSVTWPRPLQELRNYSLSYDRPSRPISYACLPDSPGCRTTSAAHTRSRITTLIRQYASAGQFAFLFDSILTVLHAAILQARRCSLTGRKLSILSHVLCGHLFYDLLVVLLPFQFLVCVKFHFLTPSVRKN